MFNIKNIDIIEKAKYSTKNEISEEVPLFLAIKNHTRARNISTMNLVLIAARR